MALWIEPTIFEERRKVMNEPFQIGDVVCLYSGDPAILRTIKDTLGES